MIVAKKLIVHDILHKNPGFFSLFAKQSSFWISLNPGSKFASKLFQPKLQSSPRAANLPRFQVDTICLYLFSQENSNEVMHNFFLHNQISMVPIFETLDKQRRGSCLKPLNLGLQLCSNYIAAIWRTFKKLLDGSIVTEPLSQPTFHQF